MISFQSNILMEMPTSKTWLHVPIFFLIFFFMRVPIFSFFFLNFFFVSITVNHAFLLFNLLSQLSYYLFCHSHGLIFGLQASFWVLWVNLLSSDNCLVFLNGKRSQAYCQHSLPVTWVSSISYGVLVPFSGHWCLETRIWALEGTL